MLAAPWTAKVDPTGWHISEKLDGVRAYWDGHSFYSRNGNVFPAPEWFKKGLPSSPLDGELWAGRRQFRRCLSIVRNSSSGKLWEFVTYLCFDAPALDKPYEERVDFLKKTLAGGSSPHAAAVGTLVCTGVTHLKAELAKVEGLGGEGLMLRRPGSPYEMNKRSKSLLKVKSTKDEEAKVVGHEGGHGKNAYRLGALTLLSPDGRQFSCGTGLTDADRANPPAVGSVVTYRFTELMENGYPRFPVYWRAAIKASEWASITLTVRGPGGAKQCPPRMDQQAQLSLWAARGAFDAEWLIVDGDDVPLHFHSRDGQINKLSLS